jgi:uncharacterized protein YfaT (DUF1175 family)
MTNMKNKIEALKEAEIKWYRLKEKLLDQLRDPNMPLEKKMTILITIRQIDDDLAMAEKLIDLMKKNASKELQFTVKFWRIVEPIALFLKNME